MQDAIAFLNAALSGRYRIGRALGEGGMATVYLAEDLRHGRNVALKVLRPELAAVVGAERFLAEIRTTANLQHPHILPLHDSGNADGLLFYVMPAVGGESLKERLEREHQLPVDEAVRIATNVAEALDYAHRHGVIHRDIKPANILLLDGKPVISDFGIALAVTSGGASRLTETGLSLGTPHYMSPEQATGDQTVGPATDVWALGCVLYEMLVGDPPYMGKTPQAVLGRIVTAEPALASEVRRTVPANVDAAIRKALEKVPADRFRSAKDFAVALGAAEFGHAAAQRSESARALVGSRRMIGAMSGLAIVALAVAGVVAVGRPPSVPPNVMRFTMQVGEGDALYLGGTDDRRWGRPASSAIAFSPDGELIVYAAWETLPPGFAPSRLYTRRLDQPRASPIAGTDHATGPFFSQDGAWIGYFAGDSLRRVSTTDGAVETLVPSSGARGLPRGATWGDDGTIVYGGGPGLYRVAPSGGDPELIARDSVPPGFIRFAQPHLLPGSRVVLFHGVRSIANAESAEILALDLETGVRTTVLRNGMDPRYVETGHLLFVREGVLMAVGFDPERLEIEGDPVIVIEDVMQSLFMPDATWATGAAQLAVSHAGHLVYARGGVFPEEVQSLVRRLTDGRDVPAGPPQQGFQMVRASPTGDRLAYTAGRNFARGAFVWDIARGIPQRLATGGLNTPYIVWSPSGDTIAFSSDREADVLNVYRMPVDGSAEPERMAPSSRTQGVSSWSSQGALAYVEQGDIWIVPPGGRPTPFLASEAATTGPTFSPDGRWIAYTSNESGRNVVEVRPYPGAGAPTVISPPGSAEPAWSPDGRQVFFVQSRGATSPPVLVAVEVAVSPDGRLRPGRPVPVIDPWRSFPDVFVRSYDVLSDGSVVSIGRDLPLATGPDSLAAARSPRTMLYRVEKVELVLNFFTDLVARVPN
jgi:serine/threonine-protein kinase